MASSSFLILLLGGLVLAFVQTPKRWWTTAGGVLSLAIGFSTVLLSAFYGLQAVFETDFAEYCMAVIHFEELTLMPPKRSRLAAALPWVFGQWVALIDAISLGAIFSTALCFGALYWWGVACTGFWGGICSVAAGVFMAPLVVMPRFLTFYPEIVATTVCAAAAVCGFVSTRTNISAVLAGVGVGLCLLIDVRGLPWAGTYFVGVLFCVLTWSMHWKQKVLRLLCFLSPVWLSWFGGWYAFSAASASLEKQIDVRPLYVGFDESNPLLIPPWTYDSSYVWGHFYPPDLYKTLVFIWQQQRLPVPEAFLDWQGQGGHLSQYVDHWWTTLLIFLPLALLNANRVRFALVLSILPFLVALKGTSTMVEGHIRFFMHALPAIALCVGVGIGGLHKYVPRQWKVLPVWSGLLAIGLFSWLLVSGLVPTQLSPTAEWRLKWRLQSSDLSEVQSIAQRRQTDSDSDWVRTCGEHLRTQRQWYPSVYPRDLWK